MNSLDTAHASDYSGSADTSPAHCSLPLEIWTRCLHFAIHWQSAAYERYAKDQPPIVFDRRTAVSLTLVCHGFNEIATPLLYASVTITRPSVLQDFLSAVKAKPSLGQLVKGLHLGPQTHLPQFWFPLQFIVRKDRCGIATSLRDEKLLPRWCCPYRRWSLFGDDRSNPQEFRNNAITRAIRAAEYGINVDLKKPRMNFNWCDIGSSAWFLRVFELQAALDLYLMEMRRIEDAAGFPVESWVPEGTPSSRPQPEGPILCYPSLVVTTSAFDLSADTTLGASHRRFYLHRQQLLEHLSRRGGLTDHFDHPLVYIRSGLSIIRFSGDQEPGTSGPNSIDRQVLALYKERSEVTDQESQAFADAFTLPNEPGHTDVLPSSQPCLPATATIKGNLDLAAALLAFTPGLQHLYLSGFLQRLLCGTRSETPLRCLRSLCLGPLSLYTGSSLAPTLRGADLLKVEELRMSGTMVSAHKVSAIASLPSLRQVSWELAYATEGSMDLPTIVAKLERALNSASPHATAEDARGQSLKRGRTALESEEESPLLGKARHSARCVDISLDYFAFARQFLTTRSTQRLSSLREELSLCLPPHHLFMHIDSRRELCPPEERWDAANEEARAAYRDATRWWQSRLASLPRVLSDDSSYRARAERSLQSLPPRWRS